MNLKFFLILCIFNWPFLLLDAQIDTIRLITDQVKKAKTGKIVNFNQLSLYFSKKKKNISPLLYELTQLELAKAQNQQKQVLTIIDYLLDKFDNKLLENYWEYLIQTKADLLLQNGYYQDLNKLILQLNELSKIYPNTKKYEIHYLQLINATTNKKPISIKRPISTTSIALQRNLNYQSDIASLWTIPLQLNSHKSEKIIVDTGSPFSMIFGRRFAQSAKVTLLPDTAIAIPAAWPQKKVLLQRGIADSICIGDIKFYNLPIWISFNDECIHSDGIIGTPDLARLEVVDISKDSLSFPMPIPVTKEEPNFHMNAGIFGQCIFVPCELNSIPYGFRLDTGSSTVIVPEHYVHSQKQIVWIDNRPYSLPITSVDNQHIFQEKYGLWGHPFLYTFDKIRINFNSLHVFFGNQTDYRCTLNALNNKDHYYLRKFASDYLRIEPGKYANLINVFVASDTNQPDKVLYYSSQLNQSENISLQFILLMNREKAYFDKGEYAQAAMCSQEAIKRIDSLKNIYSKKEIERLKSIYEMDKILSDQPATSINIGKVHPVKIHIHPKGFYYVNSKIQQKQHSIILNTEDYYNSMSLNTAQKIGIRILNSCPTPDGEKGFIGIADHLNIGNLHGCYIPFFIHKHEGPTKLALSTLKKIPAIEIRENKNIIFHPFFKTDSLMQPMRSDVALYGSTTFTPDKRTCNHYKEHKLDHHSIFKPQQSIILDFQHMMYKIFQP